MANGPRRSGSGIDSRDSRELHSCRRAHFAAPFERPLWVRGCRAECVSATSGIPQIAADLPQCTSRQPWVMGCRPECFSATAAVPQIAADLLQRPSRRPRAKCGRAPQQSNGGLCAGLSWRSGCWTQSILEESATAVVCFHLAHVGMLNLHQELRGQGARLSGGRPRIGARLLCSLQSMLILRAIGSSSSAASSTPRVSRRNFAGR
jgi:hypothetical protein